MSQNPEIEEEPFIVQRDKRQRDQQLQYLQRKAAQLGFQVLALAETR
jgi:hypothetical protein